MREQIEEVLREPDIGCMSWEIGKTILSNWKAGLADQVLTLVRGKIEKVENLYIPEISEYKGFERCRYAILALFKEE